jgi:hypothetical protein
MSSNKEVTFLVSFTVGGEDPRTSLAHYLQGISDENITSIEILEDDEFDFIGGLEDDYDFFSGIS